MITAPICEFVRRYRYSGALRMHMPGHKGGPLPLPELSAGLAASIFHFGEVTIPALKRVLAEEGVCVRL